MSYQKHIDAILHDWADWVHRGGNATQFQSILHKMIVTGCVTSNSGAAYSAEIHTIEADIENALLSLAKQSDINLLRVNVLRYEYGAKSLGWPHDATQAHKAHRIGISLRTYKRHLKHSKDHVINSLSCKYKVKS